MKILIVSATQLEIEPLLTVLKVPFCLPGRIVNIQFSSHSIDILITGIGMVPTAYFLGSIPENTYDFALNLGICGAFDRTLTIGEVVNVNSEAFSELGAEDGENFLDLDQMGLPGFDEFPFTKGILKNREKSRNKRIDELKKVKGITVNTIIGNQDSIERVEKRLSPQVESMEGGAFLFACFSKKLECAQIRSISNYVEKRNKLAWNIPLAVSNLNETALEIMKSF